MKSSKSWDEFNRPDGGESNLKTISLLYFYDLLAPDFPDDVDDFLLALEDKLGGTNASKTPSGSGSNWAYPEVGGVLLSGERLI